MRSSILKSLLAVLVLSSLLLSACQPAATPTEAPAPNTAEKAPEPTATTAAPVEPTATTAAEAEPTEAAEATPTEAAEEPAGEPSAYDEVDPTGQEIVFWHNHTGSRQEFLQTLVDEFNSTNEWGIKVTQENQGSYSDIFNKMLPILNTPDVPALIVAYQNQAATYQLADSLVDMEELVNSSKYGLSEEEQADFFPGFWQQDVFPNFENARLGFPPNRSMEVLFYNIDWLTELGYDAPPATPEEFKEMACKAKETPFTKATAEGSIGYEFDPADASHFASWTFAFGGNIYDSETGEYTYNSEAAVEAATFLQDLFKEGCATLVTERYGDQTDFGAGKTLFTTSSSSGLPFYQEAADAGAKAQWSVGAIPHTTDEPVMNIYGASVSIPKSNPEQELAAWLFVKYYTSAEVQAGWAEVSGYYPVRASVAENMDEYMTKNPAYEAGFELLEYGSFEPPVPGYDFVREMLGQALAQIVGEPYPDVQPILDQLNEDANANLEEQLSQMK